MRRTSTRKKFPVNCTQKNCLVSKLNVQNNGKNLCGQCIVCLNEPMLCNAESTAEGTRASGGSPETMTPHARCQVFTHKWTDVR